MVLMSHTVDHEAYCFVRIPSTGIQIAKLFGL